MKNIEQSFVDNLYNPNASGISILEQFLDLKKLDEINQFIDGIYCCQSIRIELSNQF